MTRDELLSKLKIDLPCTADWSQMKGDDKVRHCSACGEDVYNVARMNEAELQKLFATEGRVCARLYRRRDGTVVTGDCSWVWAEARKKAEKVVDGWSLAGWVSVGAVLVVTVGLAGVTVFGDHIRKLYGTAAGGISAHPGAHHPRAGTPPPLPSGAQDFADGSEGVTAEEDGAGDRTSWRQHNAY